MVRPSRQAANKYHLGCVHAEQCYQLLQKIMAQQNVDCPTSVLQTLLDCADLGLPPPRITVTSDTVERSIETSLTDGEHAVESSPSVYEIPLEAYSNSNVSGSATEASSSAHTLASSATFASSNAVRSTPNDSFWDPTTPHGTWPRAKPKIVNSIIAASGVSLNSFGSGSINPSTLTSVSTLDTIVRARGATDV